MKTFTELERSEIERRIQNACPVMKFQGPRPEMFVSPNFGSIAAITFEGSPSEKQIWLAVRFMATDLKQFSRVGLFSFN